MPSSASGEDKTAHTSVPLTPHMAFRKLAAMHLNRYIIIMAVTSEPEWGRGLCCLWSGGGASASESPRPRTVDPVTLSRRSRQTFYYPFSLCPEGIRAGGRCSVGMWATSRRWRADSSPFGCEGKGKKGVVGLVVMEQVRLLL